ncbi:DUF6166 domain-containing protein [Lentzea xinjiangensis]|uniref:DUF6166 domain-containing protein n=1 Tax=Lentzea xinjiangensis TaxID=402600 RepID=UPI003CCC3529
MPSTRSSSRPPDRPTAIRGCAVPDLLGGLDLAITRAQAAVVASTGYELDRTYHGIQQDPETTGRAVDPGRLLVELTATGPTERQSAQALRKVPEFSHNAFTWGYDGNGPSAMAAAILADAPQPRPGAARRRPGRGAVRQPARGLRRGLPGDSHRRVPAPPARCCDGCTVDGSSTAASSRCRWRWPTCTWT